MEFKSHAISPYQGKLPKSELKELSKQSAAGDVEALDTYLQHAEPGSLMFCRLDRNGQPKLSHQAGSFNRGEFGVKTANTFSNVLRDISNRSRSASHAHIADVQQALSFIEKLCDSTDQITPFTISNELREAVHLLATAAGQTAPVERATRNRDDSSSIVDSLSDDGSSDLTPVDSPRNHRSGSVDSPRIVHSSQI